MDSSSNMINDNNANPQRIVQAARIIPVRLPPLDRFNKVAHWMRRMPDNGVVQQVQREIGALCGQRIDIITNVGPDGTVPSLAREKLSAAAILHVLTSNPDEGDWQLTASQLMKRVNQRFLMLTPEGRKFQLIRQWQGVMEDELGEDIEAIADKVIDNAYHAYIQVLNNPDMVITRGNCTIVLLNEEPTVYGDMADGLRYMRNTGADMIVLDMMWKFVHAKFQPDQVLNIKDMTVRGVRIVENETVEIIDEEVPGPGDGMYGQQEEEEEEEGSEDGTEGEDDESDGRSSEENEEEEVEDEEEQQEEEEEGSEDGLPEIQEEVPDDNHNQIVAEIARLRALEDSMRETMEYRMRLREHSNYLRREYDELLERVMGRIEAVEPVADNVELPDNEENVDSDTEDDEEGDDDNEDEDDEDEQEEAEQAEQQYQVTLSRSTAVAFMRQCPDSMPLIGRVECGVEGCDQYIRGVDYERLGGRCGNHQEVTYKRMAEHRDGQDSHQSKRAK